VEEDMGELVLMERVGSTVVLTLNRPERHNSLIPELLEALLSRIEDVQADADIRAVVLAANGRSFSTGGDVRGFYDHLDRIEAYAQQIVGLLNQTILSLLALPVPVIAAVQGIVTGGSMGLVLASDIVLVTAEASFTPYYSVVGFSPDGGWTAMLPAIIGANRTAAILLQNKRISAEEALTWGLADRLVEGTRMRQEALKVSQGLAAKKAGSIKHTKRLLFESQGNLSERLESEQRRFAQQITTREAREGMANFLGGQRQ
jgi:enoyl-CoA hydratase/carnithine racemase